MGIVGIENKGVSVAPEVVAARPWLVAYQRTPSSIRTQHRMSMVLRASPDVVWGQHPGTKKVVGMGSAGMDYLAEVASFPKPDDKMRTENLEMQGGGNCGNALTAVARLGLKPVIVSKIGPDSVGDAIIAEFEKDGVSTDHILRSKSGKSPFTYIIVDRGTNTRTCIHTPGEGLKPEEMTPAFVDSILDEAVIVYFDGRLAEGAIILAEEAQKRSIPILVEAERLRPGLDALLQYATYVVTSTHFPHDWTGKDSLDDAIFSMLSRLPRVRWIASTLGAKGSLLLERLESDTSTNPYSKDQVNVVDRLDGSLSTRLFQEAQQKSDSVLKERLEKSKAMANGLEIQSGWLATSGPIVLGNFEKSEEVLQEEKEKALAAAREAAILNADSGNEQGYAGTGKDVECNESSGSVFRMTAIQAASIPKASIVDTTGAGDAFIGSLVFSMAIGMDPVRGCELGSLVAACKCTALGARPGLPRSQEIQIK